MCVVYANCARALATLVSSHLSTPPNACSPSHHNVATQTLCHPRKVEQGRTTLDESCAREGTSRLQDDMLDMRVLDMTELMQLVYGKIWTSNFDHTF